MFFTDSYFRNLAKSVEIPRLHVSDCMVLPIVVKLEVDDC